MHIKEVPLSVTGPAPAAPCLSLLWTTELHTILPTVALPGLSSKLLTQIWKMQPTLSYYFFSNPRFCISLWFSYRYEFVLSLNTIAEVL